MLQAYEPAVKHFERVTRLDPRRGASWINLGAVYNRMGNHHKAAEVLRRAPCRSKRNRASAITTWEIAYKHLKQWNLAIPAYREAIRLDPKMADAYLNLGNVYSQMNNFGQAVAHFKKALDIEPGMDRAVRGLEKAEAGLAAAKPAPNPFGRLVNPDETPAATAAPLAPARELGDDERIRDRRRLHDLLAQLEPQLSEVLVALSEELDPAVRTLNKMLTQPVSPHGVSMTKAEALDGFILARAKYLPRRAKLAMKTMRQLRDHEAQIS